VTILIRAEINGPGTRPLGPKGTGWEHPTMFVPPEGGVLQEPSLQTTPPFLMKTIGNLEKAGTGQRKNSKEKNLRREGDQKKKNGVKKLEKGPPHLRGSAGTRQRKGKNRKKKGGKGYPWVTSPQRVEQDDKPTGPRTNVSLLFVRRVAPRVGGKKRGPGTRMEHGISSKNVTPNAHWGIKTRKERSTPRSRSGNRPETRGEREKRPDDTEPFL